MSDSKRDKYKRKTWVTVSNCNEGDAYVPASSEYDCHNVTALHTSRAENIISSLDSADYDIKCKIERIVFTFTSRDQGWEENFGLKLLAI